MNVVITMAGLGSRFKQAGYTMPKYMINAHGKSLFEWSMMSLSGYYDDANQYIFIIRQEDEPESFIADRCESLGIKNYKLILIDYLTDGQATTALLANRYWHPDQALLIYNIDTFVEPGQMSSKELRGDGFIPCFTAPGDHWSFVKVDKEGIALEVREKKRISDHCTLGAYYFKSCTLYEQLYQEYYSVDGRLEKGEKYVAPMYNQLIKKGGQVFISSIDAEKVHVLGTPEQLNLFLAMDVNSI